MMSLSLEKRLGNELLGIYDKVSEGKRLNFEDGLALFRTQNLNGVGYLANIVRERLHGRKTYYVRNQHINYTNICNKFCKFCSFYAKKGGPDPYQMSIEDIELRLNEYKHLPLTEIHIVGGINPRLKYQYYLDAVRAVKKVRPDVHVKAFTSVEIEQIAKVGKVTIDQALKDLKEAGLTSITGGGIEILSDRVHQEVFGKKLNGDEWKTVARAAAKAGMPGYVTMLYGHVETNEERVHHLLQLRELQDETEHFLAITPLSFHPEGSELSHLPNVTGNLDLRTIAATRLILDNIQHVKSFWIMNTIPITQAALWYGADDADGLIQEYEITYKEGAFGHKKQALTHENMIRMIEEAYSIPIERDSIYNEIIREPSDNENISWKKQPLRILS